MAVIISAIFLMIIIFFSVYKFEQERVKRAVVEKRLTESLKGICEQMGIELSYHENLGTAAGRILYYEKNGWLFVDSAKIEILEKFKDEPYTLAHELGHYMAIKQRQDDSERGADNEADKLCRSVLNKEEQKLLSICLSCYFHTL